MKLCTLFGEFSNIVEEGTSRTKRVTRNPAGILETIAFTQHGPTVKEVA